MSIYGLFDNKVSVQCLILTVPDEPVYHGVEAVHELGGDDDYDQEEELEKADLVALDQISQI